MITAEQLMVMHINGFKPNDRIIRYNEKNSGGYSLMANFINKGPAEAKRRFLKCEKFKRFKTVEDAVYYALSDHDCFLNHYAIEFAIRDIAREGVQLCFEDLMQ